MPRMARFCTHRKKCLELKVDKICRIGHTYEGFIKLYEENPSLPIVELDSGEGQKGCAVFPQFTLFSPSCSLLSCVSQLPQNQ